MFSVRNKRFERKENIKSRFLRRINDCLDRKDHLEKMLMGNDLDKILVEWEG